MELSIKQYIMFKEHVIMNMLEQKIPLKRNGRIDYHRNWNYDSELWDVLIQVMSRSNPALLKHSVQVANLATTIAMQMGLSQKQVDLIIRASLYHDIGKLGLPQSILSKPGPLTSLEYQVVKTHPELSAALLQECSGSHLLIPILRHHHEYFNGEGYPDGIAGENIEIEARILFVSEVISSMMSDTSYRQAYPLSRVISELHRHSGTKYDPRVARTTIRILQGWKFKRRDGSMNISYRDAH